MTDRIEIKPGDKVIVDVSGSYSRARYECGVVASATDKTIMWTALRYSNPSRRDRGFVLGVLPADTNLEVVEAILKRLDDDRNDAVRLAHANYAAAAKALSGASQ